MKRRIAIIGTIMTISVLSYGSYLLGASNAKVETKVITVTVEKEIEVVKEIEIVLETIEVVKEIEIVKEIEVVPYGYVDCNTYCNTNEFLDRYVDMDTVTGFEVGQGGLQLYMGDGTGYYWEMPVE